MGLVLVSVFSALSVVGHSLCSDACLEYRGGVDLASLCCHGQEMMENEQRKARKKWKGLVYKF